MTWEAGNGVGGDLKVSRMGWLWLEGDGADGGPEKTGKSGGSRTAPPQKFKGEE